MRPPPPSCHPSRVTEPSSPLVPRSTIAPPPDAEFEVGAKNAVVHCLAIRAGERVAIVTHPGEAASIAEALRLAAKAVGADVDAYVLSLEEASQPAIATALVARLASYHASFLVSTLDGLPVELRRRVVVVGQTQRRHGHLIGITPAMMSQSMRADYGEVDRLSVWLATRLVPGASLHATAPGGTDLRIRLDAAARVGVASGVLLDPGWTNLPGGEVFALPSSVDGVLVPDGGVWDPDGAKLTTVLCLAFPDVYDIGMSHLGFKILYKILNDDPRTLAERCYAPWVDMEAELTRARLPLVSLESGAAAARLRRRRLLAPVRAHLHQRPHDARPRRHPAPHADRGEDDPLVIAGGPVATHPSRSRRSRRDRDRRRRGDVHRGAAGLGALKKAGVPRRERLRALAKLGGVYVPSLYETALDPDDGPPGRGARPARSGAALPRARALGWSTSTLTRSPTTAPVGPEAIFDRISIEIARGCTEGCRFCQAGMIYRPVRERDPEQIVETVSRAVKKRRLRRGLAHLALDRRLLVHRAARQEGDASARARARLARRLVAARVRPREELLDEIQRVRATGLTFAPEAGTQRMRDVVNKNVTEEQLMRRPSACSRAAGRR
jgi:radical SAM superfamily enzyme YgiQ (UPF0313 family)